jgi:hypothetical protein
MVQAIPTVTHLYFLGLSYNLSSWRNVGVMHWRMGRKNIIIFFFLFMMKWLAIVKFHPMTL